MSDARGLPNLIYLGPDKAGSTWLAEVLSRHPDIAFGTIKDLYFFDKEFGRGLDWCARQFKGCEAVRYRADFSHDYLYARVASDRIRATVPDARLLVCLRDPVDRAFSAYLYLVRLGLTTSSFEQALDEHPELVDHGRYSLHLPTYSAWAGRDQLHVALYDDLRIDPVGYVDAILRWLDLDTIGASIADRSPVLAAGAPRNRRVAAAGKALAIRARDRGWTRGLGRVKRSAVVQRVLYRSYDAATKPTIDPTTQARLRRDLAAEVGFASDVLGRDLHEVWGY